MRRLGRDVLVRDSEAEPERIVMPPTTHQRDLLCQTHWLDSVPRTLGLTRSNVALQLQSGASEQYLGRALRSAP